MYNHPKTRPATFTIAALIFGAACVSPLWAAEQTHYALFQRVQEHVLRYSFYTVFDDVSAEKKVAASPSSPSLSPGRTQSSVVEEGEEKEKGETVSCLEEEFSDADDIKTI